ncbi:unnamed protein product [Prorocentrum cordatum]|uniref:Reverse transcriptase domain-containing protein n=1 Tax=Prorocentrum cordatum TaxID=2364126 RepID=A0ABN9U797_9DINO|nr:unnamed protein product [Polarella glacialis]
MEDSLTAPPTRGVDLCGVEGAGLTCAGLTCAVVFRLCADADQAFEACDAPPVMEHWETVAEQYVKATGEEHISVMKGRRFVARPGQQAAGASWLVFTLGDLQRAIASFTVMSLVCVVGHAFSLKGIPIGGVMSGICVAVSIGAQEYNWRRNSEKHRQNGYTFEPHGIDKCIVWRRYVDDVLICSRRYCRKCLIEFLGAGIQVKFAPTGPLAPDAEAVGVWLDVQLYVSGQSLTLLPKNVNRDWLYTGSSFASCTSKPGPQPWTDADAPAAARQEEKRIRKKERRLRKAKELLLAEDAQYRAWHEHHERRKSEEALRAQGQAFASAFNEKLEELTKAVRGGAGAGGGEAAAPAAEPVQDDKWSSLRIRWLAAELGGNVEFPKEANNNAKIIEVVTSEAQQNKDVRDAIQELLQNNMAGKPIPRAIASRTKMLVEWAAEA